MAGSLPLWLVLLGVPFLPLSVAARTCMHPPVQRSGYPAPKAEDSLGGTHF